MGKEGKTALRTSCPSASVCSVRNPVLHEECTGIVNPYKCLIKESTCHINEHLHMLDMKMQSEILLKRS